jgi:hypothetical protein
MGELRDKMERDMLLKNLSDRTRKTYLACVRDFVRFHKHDPRDLGDEEIKLDKHRWVEARLEDLLPIAYCHVVFTIPAELRPLALRNQEVVYGILFRTRLARCAVGVDRY